MDPHQYGKKRKNIPVFHVVKTKYVVLHKRNKNNEIIRPKNTVLRIRRLDVSQYETMPACAVRILESDVLQEVLTGPRRTTHHE